LLTYAVVLLGPSGLSNLRVSVPSIVLRGETTNFNCSWDQDPKDKVLVCKELVVWFFVNIE
jgi:hypothetical protein